MPLPRLTVFTPFHDDIGYLDETIGSVLAQSFSDFEYLLINDGGPAQEQSIRARFPDPRLRIITPLSPLGLSASRDAGLREARGELIAFIDADDVCEPDRFTKQIAFLDAHPDHVLVGSALRLIDERSNTIGHRRYPERDEDIRRKLLVINCIAQPAVMARRDKLIEAGGYTRDFVTEDYDLWLRAARIGKLHNLPEELVAYRLHGGAQKSSRLRPTLRDSVRVKVHAVRRYGYPLTVPAAASIAAHLLLMLLPDRTVLWLFRRLFTSAR